MSNTRTGITAPLLVTLAFLSGLAPMATDLYLSAFPVMVAELMTSSAGVQLSLTAFLIGAGVGQVIFGLLSDRMGRRTPLLFGLGLFVLASFGAAFAPTIASLITARFLQGVAGASGMVIGRAIIADLAQGAQAARAFSVMMLVGSIAPIAAPFLGSTLFDMVGWRGLLMIVAVLGILTLPIVLLFIRESLPEAGGIPILDDAIRPENGLIETLGSRQFLGYAISSAFTFATVMAYISASPFLYQNLMGLSRIQYGVAFGMNALLLMIVGGISATLTGRFAFGAQARLGLLINLGATALILLLAAIGASPMFLALAIPIAVASIGLVIGNITALALDCVKRANGSASAVLGLLQFGLAGLAAPLVSVGGQDTALAMAVVMFATSLFANLAFSLAAQSAALRCRK